MLEFSNSLYNLLNEHKEESKVADALLHQYRATTQFGNYLAISRGQITYLPAGRKHIRNEDGTWAPDNRQEGRPAKIIRRFISDHYSEVWLIDKDFEIFANIVKSKDLASMGTIKLVSGEDIRYWYDGEKYGRNTASLYTSCMRYDHCRPFFNIYVENPEICNMLILVDKNVLQGRALVWKLPDGTTFMDRIYGNDMVIEGFRDYARDQGWAYRAYNSYQHERSLVIDGKIVNKNITLKIKGIRQRYYPYMDTFKYLNPRAETISNVHANGTHTIANQHGEVNPAIDWNYILNPQPVRNVNRLLNPYLDNLEPIREQMFIEQAQHINFEEAMANIRNDIANANERNG
jgi:hypothetical protein